MIAPRLTVHKTQALSIKHVVKGCLEAAGHIEKCHGSNHKKHAQLCVQGVFAWGQVYVLISRVTDPENFQLVGIPPLDLVHDVRLALRAAGFDPDDVFTKGTAVSNEWQYDPLQRKFSQKRISERTVPMTHRPLHEVLDPQPRTAEVLMCPP